MKAVVERHRRATSDMECCRRLIPERKQFLDTIKLISYRAETSMASVLRETLTRSDVSLANCYFPEIPQDSPSCYHSSMRNLAVLFIHLIAVLARLLGPGGVRSVVAESLLLKHQLLIVNRSRQRSPNLRASDRILAGWMALLVRPTRLLRSAIVLKPSTLLGLHKAIVFSNPRMSLKGKGAGGEEDSFRK